MNESRLKYLDIARGIGICLVVAGHSLVTPMRNADRIFQALYDGIYFFHMSFFFFLSGYLTSATGKRQRSTEHKVLFFRKTAMKLLIPYLFYSFLGYALLGAVSGKKIQQCLWEIITTENHLFHHLWFLYTMFMVSVLDLFIPEKYIGHIIIATAVLHGGLSAVKELPLICLYIVRYLFFYEAGHLYQIKRRFSGYIDVCIFIITELLYILFFSDPAPLNGGLYFTERFMCSTAICVGGIVGSRLILDFSVRIEQSTGMITKLFEITGKNSMEIYLLHMPLLVPGLGTVMWKVGMNGGLILISCILAGICIPMFLAHYIHRSRFLSIFMFGRAESKEDT